MDGQSRAHRETPARSGARLERAAAEERALLHPEQAMAAPRSAVRATAVVDDLELDVIGRVAHEHLGLGRAGVLERVRQGFLDDAERTEVDAGRQGLGVALDLELNGKPRLAYLLDEQVDALKRRLRAERAGLLGLTQDPEQPPDLGQRLATHLLDAE